jgi:hypothetical protein
MIIFALFASVYFKRSTLILSALMRVQLSVRERAHMLLKLDENSI